ncbi:hypothetical protein [Parasediminibacterium sp. JCM 36343]|uniref:hypothetical protein n=1 Tax=Parasediminibacterium sp. JCM 36343 TaxID=3374279 RepID=UPI00397A825C
MKQRKRLVTLIALALLMQASAMAQVTIALQVPPTGVMQKSQLWNFLLVSSSATPLRVAVKLTLLSSKDNMPVMTATSRGINLPKGAKQVGINDVAPVQYSYLSSMFNVDRNPNGFLPVGNFQACYTVIKLDGDLFTELGEECLPVEVAPLNPPLLNLPLDKDTVSTAYPQFAWLPPAPLNLFNNLSYDFVLVEMLPNQATLDAIQQNIPVYSSGNNKALSLAYPASAKALDSTKQYAWQVTAENNGQPVAKSEVWQFVIGNNNPKPQKIFSGNYILLKKGNESTGMNIVEDGNLGIKYYSFDQEYGATIHIVDKAGKEIKQVTQKIIYGDNYLLYKLGSQFQTGGQYQVWLVDRQNGKHTATFTIK